MVSDSLLIVGIIALIMVLSFQIIKYNGEVSFCKEHCNKTDVSVSFNKCYCDVFGKLEGDKGVIINRK